MTDEQRQLIRSLSENIPKLWQAPTTTPADRQRIVRLLIDRVEVAVQGTTERVDMSLHWSGGFLSRHEMIRPIRRYTQTADYGRLVSRIEELLGMGRTYSQIADQLNQDGFQPSKQTKTFNKSIVGRLAKKQFGRQSVAPTAGTAVPLKAGEWIVNDLAEKLDIPRTTLMTWIKRGWVGVSRQLSGYRGRIICWADADELDRLQELRKARRYYGDPPLPKDLTTPKTATTD